LQSEEKEKKKKKIVNSQLGAYHQKNGSAWKSTPEKRMSFLRRLLLQRDPMTTEKLQNGLVNEEVCKIVATHE
jgi:hypothetical protein